MSEQKRSISVNDRLIEINKELQTFYIEAGNISAFSYNLKSILENLREFINVIEPILGEEGKHKTAQFKDHINVIIEGHVKREYDNIPYWEANKFLSWAKKDASTLCFDIAQICGNYPFNILNKVIEVV